MTIKFVDLGRQYEAIGAEIDATIADVLRSTAFIGGEFVTRFEREFADYCEAEHCIGVANGTDALELSLLALGIGRGDEVITVANTFIATAAAITAIGATPVFVDVDPDTYQMDARRLPGAITQRTRAIIPVHLYGHPVELDAILSVGEAYNLPIIEDACQAHGARYHGRRVGALGTIGCFSFYPGKNLGAYGDGGALVTNSPELAARVRQLADHGRTDKYCHARVGRNSRLDGLQAAVLSVKLHHLDHWNDARRAIAAALTMRLDASGVIPPTIASGVEPVFHLYVVRVADREATQRALDEAGIASGVHYPIPLHLQPAYRELARRAGLGPGSFPVTEAHADQILSLPIYAELTDEEVARIAAVVKSAMAVPA